MRCLTSVDAQRQYALKASMAPTAEALYDEPELRSAFPMADLLRLQFSDEHATSRPATPGLLDAVDDARGEAAPRRVVGPGEAR